MLIGVCAQTVTAVGIPTRNKPLAKMEVNRDVKATDYKSYWQHSRGSRRNRFVRHRVRLVGVVGDIRSACLSKWWQPGRWLLVVDEVLQVGEETSHQPVF